MKDKFKSIGPDMWLTWKEIGQTPLEAMEYLRKIESIPAETKMTYAGRLDPAAEGWLLVLAGEKCKEKDNYLGLDKKYDFTVLFGIKTDTLDPLGLITEVDIGDVNIDEVQVADLATSFIGKKNWQYPMYSSKTLNGKALWELARNKELPEYRIPKNDFEIYDLELSRVAIIKSSDLLKKVAGLTEKVQGDFRQREILNTWKGTLVDQEKGWATADLSVVCSSGTYVRQIAERLGGRVGLPSLALKITRTEIIDIN